LSTYAFEAMTPQQAAAFTSADHVILTSVLATPANVTVAFSGADVTITSGGRSLTFGAAFTSQIHSIRPDGQFTIVIGTPQDDEITGISRVVGIVGQFGDALYGGAGNDTLTGLGDTDTLWGGPGADLFVGAGDVIADFERSDRLAFGLAPAADRYLEATAATATAAVTLAAPEISAGRATVVAVQVGADVIVFGATTLLRGVAANSPPLTFMGATLRNRTLADLDPSNFVASPVTTALAPPSPPPVDAPPPPEAPSGPGASAPAAPVLVQTSGASGTVQGNLDQLHFSGLQGGQRTTATDATLTIDAGATRINLAGSLFTYDMRGGVLDGRVHRLEFAGPNGVAVNVDTGVFGSIGVRVSAFEHWVTEDASQQALMSFFEGNDTLTGSAGADVVRAHVGNDVLAGGGGADSLFGGAGDDVIYAAARPGGTAAGNSGGTYLRGDEGSDWIGGGTGFDDINGNMGHDTATGGLGDDWVVGGKDNDLLFGNVGGDLVYGNLGNDTCDGGEGADTIRGGQDDDVVRGFSGADYVSGDRGDDTMTGGTGADLFHSFGSADLDLVTDFNFAEGDRVLLDPGTRYTVRQVVTDVEIDMEGGGKMILQGVFLTSLGAGWIIGA